MYFTLTFDILTKDNKERTEIMSFIKKQFDGLYWAKPLSTHYVVKCNDERRRRKLINTLIEYSKQKPKKLRFIVSPLIEGKVTGLTSKELWPHLGSITKSEFDDFDGYL